jgi:hypothetical protein
VVINRKIVRFVPEGAEEYVRLQGFHWGSSNALQDVMRGYAWSGQKFPFLEILQEGGPENVPQPTTRQSQVWQK